MFSGLVAKTMAGRDDMRKRSEAWQLPQFPQPFVQPGGGQNYFGVAFHVPSVLV
jgi:hypothetical protein